MIEQGNKRTDRVEYVAEGPLLRAVAEHRDVAIGEGLLDETGYHHAEFAGLARSDAIEKPRDYRELLTRFACRFVGVFAPLDVLDYVAIGGVYGTTSKDNTAAPIGIDGLRTIVQVIRARDLHYPICAIAGINSTNAADVIAAGADGVAVISALSLASDPAAAAQDLRAVVDSGLARRGRL